MAPIRIDRLHPALGAEVAGVDLAAPLDDSTRDALTRALADHLALVFRAQSLTPAQYLAAASAFGPPMEQHYSQHNMPDFPLIGLIWHRNGQQPAEQWHTDHTNRERPPADGISTPWRMVAAAPAWRACARPISRSRGTSGDASRR
jgi:taurine dioxygenase